MKFIEMFFGALFLLGVIFGVVFVSSQAQTTTPDRFITIAVEAPSFINRIQVAQDPGFSQPLTLPAAPTVSFDICTWNPSCTAGTYDIYVRYLDGANRVRFSSQRSVAYAPVLPVVSVTPPAPEPEPEPERPVEPAPIIVEPEPEPPAPVVEPEPIVPEPEPPMPMPEESVSWLENPATRSVVGTIAVAGVVGTLSASIASIFGGAFQISQLVFLPIRIWNLFLIFVGIRRRSQPWGVVYDSETKQPLDPVYVQLLDTDGNEVATSITDINGRYGFFVENDGNYTIVAGKTNYRFPSEAMASVTNDTVYDEVYHGDPLPLTSGQVITRNIPMDPEGEDWNQAEKKRMKVGGVSPALAMIMHILFYGGLLFTLIMFIVSPTQFNVILLIVYMAMELLRTVGFHPRAFGVIRANASGQGLAHAVVKIFNAKLGHRVGQAVTDDRGRYYALVPKGEYYVEVQKKQGETYETQHTSESFHARSGVVNRTFKI